MGGRADLPCDIEIPHESDAISLILWYHGDSRGIPIYSLDSRDLPLHKARPFPSAEYIHRAYFDVMARPPFLKLEPVLESDVGEYRCRVDYSRQRTQNRIIKLEVVGKCTVFSFTRSSSDITKPLHRDKSGRASE